jgi:hypothetical protein
MNSVTVAMGHIAEVVLLSSYSPLRDHMGIGNKQISYANC